MKHLVRLSDLSETSGWAFIFGIPRHATQKMLKWAIAASKFRALVCREQPLKHFKVNTLTRVSSPQYKRAVPGKELVDHCRLTLEKVIVFGLLVLPRQ